MALLLVAVVHPSPAMRRVQDYAVHILPLVPQSTLALASLGKYAKMEAAMVAMLAGMQTSYLWRIAARVLLRAHWLGMLAGQSEALLIHAADLQLVSEYPMAGPLKALQVHVMERLHVTTLDPTRERLGML